jgi:hypothetical protein
MKNILTKYKRVIILIIKENVMNIGKIYIALISIFLLVSCVNDKGQENIDPDTIVKNNNVIDLSKFNERLRIKLLLLSQDELSTKAEENILFMEKANFGIPGGDNWIVDWGKNGFENSSIMLYSIKEDTILERVSLGPNFNWRPYSKFDPLRWVNGYHIGTGASVYWDFNKDGIYEILRCGFYGMGNYIEIVGYENNPENNNVIYYCEIPFGIIDPINGPDPIMFGDIYKGMEGLIGFRVYYLESTVASGPSGYQDPPNPNNGKWIFYAWDDAERKFLEMGEYEK